MSENTNKRKDVEIEKILVAIDGSDNGDKAIDYALWLAERIEAEVELFNVVEPVKVPVASQAAPGVVGTIYLPGWANTYYEELIEHNKKMLEKKFNEATETHSGLKISKKVVEGRPQSEIVKEAEENSFDLIVMGSRGLNELEEIVLGSVSDAVVNRSKVPVFIVK
jgi:nucleotide-binding universal stress UspA family protein